MCSSQQVVVVAVIMIMIMIMITIAITTIALATHQHIPHARVVSRQPVPSLATQSPGITCRLWYHTPPSLRCPRHASHTVCRSDV